MLNVAEKAGVSTATVSRVINNPDVVDEKTRTLVRDAIAALNYVPNATAQGLASKSSRTIGVVVNSFASDYFGGLLEGIEDAVSELKYKAISESSRHTGEGQEQAWRSLVARQCESVVVHADRLSPETLSELLKKYPNSVILNQRIEGYEDQCVYLDNVDAGRKAAGYLLDRGHTKLAMVTGNQTRNEVADRTEGFIAGLESRGFSVSNDLLVESDFTELGGRAAMENLLQSNKEFSAVFLQNDYMAVGALEVCKERGVSVPDDVSIIGFDDDEYTRFTSPKLTTVHQPVRLIGIAAAKLAHSLANGLHDAGTVENVFEATIMDRESVANLLGQR